jgi:hypothetical protein
LFAILDDALHLTCRSVAFRFKPNASIEVQKAPIAILLVNVAQIVVIFAIAYQARDLSAPLGHHITGTDHLPLNQGPFGYVYVSWTTLFTLGSAYSTSDPAMEAYTMAEVACGLLVIGTGLATFIGRMMDPLDSAASEQGQITQPPPPSCGALIGRGRCARIGRCRIASGCRRV